MDAEGHEPDLPEERRRGDHDLGLPLGHHGLAEAQRHRVRQRRAGARQEAHALLQERLRRLGQRGRRPALQLPLLLLRHQPERLLERREDEPADGGDRRRRRGEVPQLQARLPFRLVLLPRRAPVGRLSLRQVQNVGGFPAHARLKAAEGGKEEERERQRERERGREREREREREKVPNGSRHVKATLRTTDLSRALSPSPSSLFATTSC